MIIKRTKLFWKKKKPVVDIRSYERDEAMRKNEGIEIILTNEDGKEVERMILTLEQLKDETIIVSKTTVPSKIYPGTSYDLISYFWKKKTLTAKEKKTKKTAEAWAKYNSLSDEEKLRFRT